MLKTNSNLRLALLIDLTFYIYSFFGFIGAINIAVYFNFPMIYVSLVWSIIFIPILIMKFYKEINKDKFNKALDNEK